jgi:hypothetical protein
MKRSSKSKAEKPQKAPAKKPQKSIAVEPQDQTAALLTTRFEATIFPGSRPETSDWANELNVDRVPDAFGRIRALVTVEDLVRLLDQGFEVRLYRAYPLEPLDPALIMSDEAHKSWLEKRVTALKANPDPKPFEI